MQDAHASQAPEVHIGGTFMQLASGAVAQYANGKHAWHWLEHWEQSSGCGEGGGDGGGGSVTGGGGPMQA